jgi:hypothetical protein
VRTVSRHNLIAYAVGAVIVVPLVLPVLDNIEEGRRLVAEGVLTAQDRLRPTGLGPVSGLMVFVFATPIAIHLARTLGSKLMAVFGLALLALLVSLITGILEQGDLILGLSMAWLTLAGLVAGGVWGWRRSQRQRRQVRKLAEALTAAAREAAAESGTSAVEALAGDLRGDRRTTDLVEKMVLGAIWESSAEGPPETFPRRLMATLGEVRGEIAGSVALDPDGRGLILADRMMARIEHRLRRSGRAPR